MKKVRKIVYLGGGFYKKVLPIFIILLVFGITISYAYFTAQNDIGKLEDNALEEQTAVIQGTELTLAGERLKAEGTNVYPGHKEIVKLTVSALHDNGPVNYNLEWVGTNSLTSEVTYKIYKSGEDLTPTITCATKSIPGESMIQYYEECNISNFGTLEGDGTYQEGIIEHADIETTQTLLYYEEITGNEDPKKVYYYVVIEYPNDPSKSQDGDAENRYNGSFKLNIGSIPKTKKVQTSIGELEVNTDTPNFSNTSCLAGTNNATHSGSNCGEETNGLYKETTSLGDTYYYRGSVNNNWVKYGTTAEGQPIWWRIIRINEDRTVRLIYAGEGNDAPASTDQVSGQGGYWMSNSYGIGNKGYAFNKSSDYNTYVGYMYGTPNSQTFEAEHGYDLIDSGAVDQLQSSDIKKTIDEWYVKNLADEGSVLSGKTGFCGDRTPAVYKGSGYTNNGYGTEKTYYKAYDRIARDKIPSLECPDSKHDLYTTKTEKGNGNGALDYPIGLITVDETVYAGTNWNASYNYGFWLRTGHYYWSLSPYVFDGYAIVFYVDSNGVLDTGYVNDAIGVEARPTVNLKAEALTTEGKDGTINNPYIVES